MQKTIQFDIERETKNTLRFAVDKLGTRVAHAVRADSPGAAVQRLLETGVRHFQHVDVVALDEALLELSEPQAEVTP